MSVTDETTRHEVLDVDSIVQNGRVHQRVYTDSRIFELELDRIFSRSWVFVAHESELKHPGDYKTTYIGRQPVIVSRDQHGAIHVLANRCMHRGSLVCVEGQGNSNHFRCPYHGWTYRNDGSLIGVPHRNAYGPDFDQTTLNLVRAPRVDTYRGFVFASLSSAVPSLPDHLGPAALCLDNVVDRAPAGELDLCLGVQRYEFRANWKLQIENVIDDYHVRFVHESTAEKKGKQFKRQSGISEEVVFDLSDKGTDFDATTVRAFPQGHSFTHRPDIANPNTDDPHVRRYVELLTERLGDEGTQRLLRTRIHNAAIYPNLVIQEPSSHIRVIRPIAVDRTQVDVYPMRLLGAPDEINRGIVRSINVTHSPASFIQTDDTEIFRRCQEGLQASAAEWVLFTRGQHSEARGQFPGELTGAGTHESGQRVQFHRWKQLMRAPDRLV